MSKVVILSHTPKCRIINHAIKCFFPSSFSDFQIRCELYCWGTNRPVTILISDVFFKTINTKHYCRFYTLVSNTNMVQTSYLREIKKINGRNMFFYLCKIKMVNILSLLHVVTIQITVKYA